MFLRPRLDRNCLTHDPSGVLARDARCRLPIIRSAGDHWQADLQITPKSAATEPASGSIGQCGGSYCRRPDSVSGWMVSAVCQRLLLTNHFCHSYQPKMAIIPTFSLWFWFAQQLRPCFLQPCRRPSGVRRARAGKTQNPYRAAAYIPLRPDFS